MKKTELPQFLVHAGYFAIKNTLEKKGEFSIEELEMLDVVRSLHDLPALFLASQQDTTIAPIHSEELYSEHSCEEKKLHWINGLHN